MCKIQESALLFRTSLGLKTPELLQWPPQCHHGPSRAFQSKVWNPLVYRDHHTFFFSLLIKLGLNLYPMTDKGFFLICKFILSIVIKGARTHTYNIENQQLECWVSALITFSPGIVYHIFVCLWCLWGFPTRGMVFPTGSHRLLPQFHFSFCWFVEVTLNLQSEFCLYNATCILGKSILNTFFKFG